MFKTFTLVKRLVLLCFMSYALFLLNGCAKTTQFDDVWESSLKGCALNCHSPGGSASPGPDMSTQDKFYANVVGKTVANDYPDWITDPTKATTSTCTSMQMIKPDDANNSSLVASLVLSISDMQTCNTSFNTHLTEQVTSTTNDWAELVKWINNGAPKD